MTTVRATAVLCDSPERLAVYFAHELRTPLATQRALLELALADSGADAERWREVGESVLRSCIYQERLLEACVALARSRGRTQRRDPVDLAGITTGALEANDLSGLTRAVELETAWTSGDPELLERLAANLVSNAVRHNIVGGRIEVATRAESGRAVLCVSNSGPLVPAAELSRLFEPFQRLNSTPRSSAGGIGLGLAIVRAIADAHEATITARANPGGGLELELGFLALD